MKGNTGGKPSSLSSILVRRSRASADDRSVSSRQSSAKQPKTVRFMIGPNITAGRLSVEKFLQTKKDNKSQEKEKTSGTRKQSSILHDLSTLETQLKSLMPSFNISPAPTHSMTVFKAKPHSVGTFPLQNRPVMPLFNVSKVGDSAGSLQISDWQRAGNILNQAGDKEKPKSDPSVALNTRVLPLQRSSSEYRIKAVPHKGVYVHSSNPPSLEFLPDEMGYHQARYIADLVHGTEISSKKQTAGNYRNEADFSTAHDKPGSAKKHFDTAIPSQERKPTSHSIFYSTEGLVAGENFQQPFRDVGLLKRYRIAPAHLQANRAESALMQNTAPLFFPSSRGGPSRETGNSHRSEKEVWLAKQKVLSQSSRSSAN